MIQSPVFWMVLFGSVVAFWLLPRRHRYWFLGTVSFAYVLSMDMFSGLMLTGWMVAFWALAPWVAQKNSRGKLALAVLLLGVLSYLAFFKYIPRLAQDFFPDSWFATIGLPLGISFLTFKLIHYIAEVRRGAITDRSFGKFFSYLFLFPIFTAGPIERYDHFLANLEDRPRRDDFVVGGTRIVHGLVKKFVLGDLLLLPLLSGLPNAGRLLETLDTTDGYPEYKIWAWLVGSFLYGYLDFSGYSDIAIGCSRLFGIRIMENFNWPLLAPNIGVFWQRWHMTLAGWCKSYVYLPVMGLTRSPWAAVYSTFLIMGLWHGGSLNWVMWGLYNATGVMTYLLWANWLRKKRIRMPSRGPFKYWGVPVTFTFACGMAAFPLTDGLGGWSALRVLAKCFWIDLPALPGLL